MLHLSPSRAWCAFVVAVFAVASTSWGQLVVPISRTLRASAISPTVQGTAGQTSNPPDVVVAGDYGMFSNSASATTPGFNITGSGSISSTIGANGIMGWHVTASASSYGGPPVSPPSGGANMTVVFDLAAATFFQQDIQSFGGGAGGSSASQKIVESTLGDMHVPFNPSWDFFTRTTFFTLPAGHYTWTAGGGASGAAGGQGSTNIGVSLKPIPEPTSVAIVGIAAFALAMRRGRKQ